MMLQERVRLRRHFMSGQLYEGYFLDCKTGTASVKLTGWLIRNGCFYLKVVFVDLSDIYRRLLYYESMTVTLAPSCVIKEKNRSFSYNAKQKDISRRFNLKTIKRMNQMEIMSADYRTYNLRGCWQW